MAKPTDPDHWYTAREAASMLAEVTEATVKLYCKQGKLKAKKVGPKKRWMISRMAIDRLRREWGLE